MTEVTKAAHEAAIMTEADAVNRAILAALYHPDGAHTTRTDMVRNSLADYHGIHLKTPQVLRRLKKLESAGKVERQPSSYAVILCWRLKENDSSQAAR